MRKTICCAALLLIAVGCSSPRTENARATPSIATVPLHGSLHLTADDIQRPSEGSIMALGQPTVLFENGSTLIAERIFLSPSENGGKALYAIGVTLAKKDDKSVLHCPKLMIIIDSDRELRVDERQKQ